jgi:branched-chain amino acid transport system substrate-binding protein
MRIKRLRSIVRALSVTLILLTGVGVWAQTIKVGALFASTGGAANLGLPEARTAKMLVDDINAQGGILGRKIELTIMDTGGSTDKAVSFARQLIEEKKVLAIIGPSTSGETMAIKPLCEENQTILLSCASAEAIVNPVAKWVFKTPQDDKNAAKWIFQTMNSMGLKRLGVVAANTGFGNLGKQQLEKYAPDYGITIAIAEIYDSQATDLTGVLTKINAQNVDAVVNWSVDPAQSIVAKNMRQLGMKQTLFQSHGFGNIHYVEAAGLAAEGIIFPCGRLTIADFLPDSHPQKKLLVKYKTDYEKQFNDPVSTFGGHAYDAILILTEAIKKAGKVDPAAVRDAIETLTVAGTAGTFSMSPTNHNGLDMTAFEMQTVKNGKFVPLKQ